jgi:hypothetical protein
VQGRLRGVAQLVRSMPTVNDVLSSVAGARGEGVNA